MLMRMLSRNSPQRKRDRTPALGPRARRRLDRQQRSIRCADARRRRRRCAPHARLVGVRGNQLEGLQIDFDAATRGLAHYAAFLSDLRQRLPRRWKLSITGLMDWSAGGAGRSKRLAATVRHPRQDRVQTYQARRTMLGYERYLASLSRLRMPSRVGLVAGGLWCAPLCADSRSGLRALTLTAGAVRSARCTMVAGAHSR